MTCPPKTEPVLMLDWKYNKKGGKEANYDHCPGWAIAPDSTKEKYTGTARNARCPCGSGEKYKRCCGTKPL